MQKVNQEEIEIQRKQVLNSNCTVELVAACTIGQGIKRLKQLEEFDALEAYSTLKNPPVFFIPSSGSGSRMFQFLFEWLESGESSPLVEEFFAKVGDLALRQLEALKNQPIDDRVNFVKRLLDRDQLNFGELPKGLIPFHQEGDRIFSSFQEQVRQAATIIEEKAHVHFTIQKTFENQISENIDLLKLPVECSFSYQEPGTDAFCFDENGNLVEEDGEALRRPAGHGALLTNLNKIDAEVVLVKNIDNVQHSSKSHVTKRTWKIITGLLKQLQNDLCALDENYSTERLQEFNEKYELLSEDELKNFDVDQLEIMLSRPTRVCGMVKNEGEPGGGPFWVKNKEGDVFKQIIEKVQISANADQQEIVASSSHFNPVFMAVSKTDCYGKRLDLLPFRDNDAYFIVEKSHKGKTIKYRELPGLWNGSMSNWNTLFVEIPSETFSPVKTVLDLTKPAHKA